MLCGLLAMCTLRRGIDLLTAVLSLRCMGVSWEWGPCCRYVEEEDLLALALNGRVRKHPVQMLCQRPPPLIANVDSVQKVAANQFPFS